MNPFFIKMLTISFQIYLVSIVIYFTALHLIENYYLHQEPFPCAGEFPGVYCLDDFKDLSWHKIPGGDN